MGAAAGAAQVGIGGLQLLEAKNQADALKRQSKFRAQQLRFNAELLEQQKAEIDRQAQKDVVSRQEQVKQMVGAQKVSLAGQGVDIDSEVAQLLERDEQQFGEEDVQTIKNNAWREAMGLEIQQADLRNQAKAALLGGEEARRQALVSGGLSAAGSFLGAAGSFGRAGAFSGGGSRAPRSSGLGGARTINTGRVGSGSRNIA